jgi:hypothetical protein
LQTHWVMMSAERSGGSARGETQMKTHLQFRSTQFDGADSPGNSLNPHIKGEKLAGFLSEAFNAHGYSGAVIEEDWGWMVDLGHADFPLWLGCASHDEPPDWLVFIEPSKPEVKRWFKKIDTRQAVGKVADLLEDMLVKQGGASDLNWWTEQDSGRR